MPTKTKHPRFTADDACRMALGAFYNAAASRPTDGPSMIGAWMLELSRKLREDDITGPHYREVISRFEREDNPPENAPIAGADNVVDNGDRTGAR